MRKSDIYGTLIAISVLYNQLIISHRAKLGGLKMHILARRLGESLITGENKMVTVADIKNNQIKLGITVPKGVIISREEVFNKIKEENVLSSTFRVIG